MFGKIKYISDNVAHVMNAGGSSGSQDLMNVHVIFEAPDQRILGEITEINPEFIKIRFLGEYINDRYINGVIRKPLLSSQIRIINENELKELVGTESGSSFTLGHSAIYKNYLIYPDINDFFSNHFSIFGNSGSGKSCGVARIIQNVFGNKNTLSYHANLFIFDAYGEYKNAFKSIDHYSEYYNYKFITTNPVEPEDVLLQKSFNCKSVTCYFI